MIWIPFYTLFKREVARFLKVIFQTVATPLINTMLYLLIFGVSLGGQISSIEGYTYLAFLIPGLVMMAALRNSLENSSGSIVTSKFCGELEDLRMVPLSCVQIAWANGLASVVRGMIVGVVTWVIGSLFYFLVEGTFLPMYSPFVLLLFLFIGAMAFAHLGLVMAMVSTNFEQVSAINTFILLPLIYLGGIFFSLEQLHPFWQKLCMLNPLLYMVSGVRYGMLGISDVSIPFALGVSFVTWALFYTLALWSLKKGSYHRW